MTARKTIYRIPDLKPDSEEIETYFKNAQGWKGPEQSKNRIGSALLLSGLVKQQVEDIFEAGMAMWKEIGTGDNRMADLDYRCDDMLKLRAEIETALRDRFAEVFEKRCRSLAEEEFIQERVPGMVVYRTWHTWSRKERKPVFRRRDPTGAGADQQGAQNVDDEVSKDPKPTVEHVDLTVEDTVVTQEGGVDHGSPTASSTSSLFSNLLSTFSPPTQPTYTPPILEIYSSKDQDELLRLNMKYLTDESTTQSTFTPSFDKLESQMREHPLVADWPDKLLFIHVDGKDKNTFVFNQATLDTAFKEWMWKESKLRAFRLYINEFDGAGRPPRIVLR
ncbi:hypothetical protein H2200_007435 [Cladophialophora chaetospira]|uniref:Uncharacterized protein n=1 Tax=Cladophialophora chaetospira TaxID=386627 RepID=A0AA38X7T4_9EURO|nr:hypothetical protein H2200_007435 [Cladophialophora chaetospira]